MRRYDIVVPKKYERNGEEKTSWARVGTLVHFPATEEKPAGFILELSMFPTTPFKVFEQKPKDNAPKTTAPVEAQSEDEQIPF